VLRGALALYRFGGELYFPDYISCGSSFYILEWAMVMPHTGVERLPLFFYADTFRVAFVFTNTTNKNENGEKYHAPEHPFIYHALSYGVLPH
jgi:hypothetical protein